MPEMERKELRHESPEGDIAADFHAQFGGADPTAIVELAASLDPSTIPMVPGQLGFSVSEGEETFANVERAISDSDIHDVSKSVADVTQQMDEMNDRIGIFGQRLDNIDNTSIVVNKEITNLRAEISGYADELSRLKIRISSDIDNLSTNLSNQISALRMLIRKNIETNVQKSLDSTHRDPGKQKEDAPSHEDLDDVHDVQEPEMYEELESAYNTSRTAQEASYKNFGVREFTSQASHVGSTSRVQLESFASRPLSTAGRLTTTATITAPVLSEFDSWDLE